MIEFIQKVIGNSGLSKFPGVVWARETADGVEFAFVEPVDPFVWDTLRIPGEVIKVAELVKGMNDGVSVFDIVGKLGELAG